MYEWEHKDDLEVSRTKHEGLNWKERILKHDGGGIDGRSAEGFQSMIGDEHV